MSSATLVLICDDDAALRKAVDALTLRIAEHPVDFRSYMHYGVDSPALVEALEEAGGGDA